MKIYIDLVPAIKLHEDFQPSRCLPLHNDGLPYHVIAKKSRYNFRPDEENCTFSYSFSLQETAFIRQLAVNIRNGYALAKAARQAEICQIDVDNAYLDPEERLYIADEITTYMLKTCMFLLYDEHKNDPTVLKELEYDWAIKIYKQLRKCFEQGKLETFYGDSVLFQCSHTDDVSSDRICCLKRKFVLRMCDAIIQWLHEHRAELQELEDVYDDCRLEVYNRDQQAKTYQMCLG